MSDRLKGLDALSRFVHHHLLWLLIGSYALAGLWPTWGLGVRATSFGSISLVGESTRVSLPMLMLALLLFNAGLGVEPGRLKLLLRGPRILFGGLVANTFVPVGFIFG